MALRGVTLLLLSLVLVSCVKAFTELGPTKGASRLTGIKGSSFQDKLRKLSGTATDRALHIRRWGAASRPARGGEDLLRLPSDDAGTTADKAVEGSLMAKRPILQQSMVETINSNPSATWAAGYNERLKDYTVADFKVLLGARFGQSPSTSATPLLRHHVPNRRHRKYPEHFDSREAWPHCPTLGDIRDQGHCGSCWAFGAVETLSDRFCIAGLEDKKLSAEDVLSCCGHECGDGCNGGFPIHAWEYFVRNGVVTSACDPYFDSAGCHHPGCSPVRPTPTCDKVCRDDESWGSSKRYAADAYTVGPSQEDIQAELLENGPLEVAFTVYEDFAHYKSGVYQHMEGYLLGGHAVKLIGWGTDANGTAYWLCANSWNKSWGENGFFRIKRGTNECGIETNVVGGLPDVERFGNGQSS